VEDRKPGIVGGCGIQESVSALRECVTCGGPLRKEKYGRAARGLRHLRRQGSRM